MCDTHKLNAAVVGEQLLDPNAPVVSGHQSTVGHMGLTQEADPGVRGFKRVEGPFSYQDVQTVFAVRPAGGRDGQLASCLSILPVIATTGALQVNLSSERTCFTNS